MSAKVKSKFKTDWQVEREWLMPVKDDCLGAECTLCKKSFSIASSGLFQVRQHRETEKHKQIAATRSGTTSQTVLLHRSCNDISLSFSKKPSFSFTPEDLTLRVDVPSPTFLSVATKTLEIFSALCVRIQTCYKTMPCPQRKFDMLLNLG